MNQMKYTLIIGAGIHAQALKGSSYSSAALASWHNLLLAIGAESFNNPLLGFESLVIKKAKDEKIAAYKAEQNLLKQIAETLEAEQTKIINDTNIEYPLSIFNPEKVSDVIILNFDLVIENLLTKGNLPKLEKSPHNDSTYRTINGIRFWHPHGCIEEPYSIEFGIRKYGKNLKVIEALRSLYKMDERNEEYDLTKIQATWYSAIMLNPLVFVGTGLSFDEWGLWFALTSRKRNFAQNGEEPPVYTLNKQVAFCNLYGFTNTKAISEQDDYDQSWQSLIEFLN